MNGPDGRAPVCSSTSRRGALRAGCLQPPRPPPWGSSTRPHPFVPTEDRRGEPAALRQNPPVVETTAARRFVYGTLRTPWPSPQGDEADHARKGGERKHGAAGQRLSWWLVGAGPYPAHGRHPEQHEDEKRGGKPDRVHERRFWLAIDP